MKVRIDRFAALVAATLLLTGCPKAEEPTDGKVTNRLEDPVYAQALDAQHDEKRQIHVEMDRTLRALEALKAEDPELTGEKAQALKAEMDALKERFEANRQKSMAIVRQRILSDVNNEKQRNLKQKGR